MCLSKASCAVRLASEVPGMPASFAAWIDPSPVSEAEYIEAWLKKTTEPLPQSSPSTSGRQVSGLGRAAPSVVTNSMSGNCQHTAAYQVSRSSPSMSILKWKRSEDGYKTSTHGGSSITTPASHITSQVRWVWLNLAVWTVSIARSGGVQESLTTQKNIGEHAVVRKIVFH